MPGVRFIRHPSMKLRKRIVLRIVRIFVYWGLIRHPYGREYAQWRYTPTGGFIEEPAESPPKTRVERTESSISEL
jgi:hypothetical protein